MTSCAQRQRGGGIVTLRFFSPRYLLGFFLRNIFLCRNVVLAFFESCFAWLALLMVSLYPDLGIYNDESHVAYFLWLRRQAILVGPPSPAGGGRMMMRNSRPARYARTDSKVLFVSYRKAKPTTQPLLFCFCCCVLYTRWQLRSTAFVGNLPLKIS